MINPEILTYEELQLCNKELKKRNKENNTTELIDKIKGMLANNVSNGKLVGRVEFNSYRRINENEIKRYFKDVPFIKNIDFYEQEDTCCCGYKLIVVNYDYKIDDLF